MTECALCGPEACLDCPSARAAKAAAAACCGPDPRWKETIESDDGAAAGGTAIEAEVPPVSGETISAGKEPRGLAGDSETGDTAEPRHANLMCVQMAPARWGRRRDEEPPHSSSACRRVGEPATEASRTDTACRRGESSDT